MRISDWSSDVCSSDLRCASIFESLKTACFSPLYRYAFHRYMLRIGAGGSMGPIMPKTRSQGSGMIHAHPPMPQNGYYGNITEVCTSRSRNGRKAGDPYGNRTRVSAVKGPRPNR